MSALDHIRRYINAWDWRLFLLILPFLALPNIYQLYRVYLGGNEIPGTGNLTLLSQWQSAGLVVEVFQEAAALAIFFFLAPQIRSGAAIRLRQDESFYHLEYRLREKDNLIVTTR